MMECTKCENSLSLSDIQIYRENDKVRIDIPCDYCQGYWFIELNSLMQKEFKWEFEFDPDYCDE